MDHRIYPWLLVVILDIANICEIVTKYSGLSFGLFECYASKDLKSCSPPAKGTDMSTRAQMEKRAGI